LLVNGKWKMARGKGEEQSAKYKAVRFISLLLPLTLWVHASLFTIDDLPFTPVQASNLFGKGSKIFSYPTFW